MLIEITLIAYLTNAACTLSRLFPNRHALDFGTGLLGSHKTLEGLLIGLNAGLLGTLILGFDFRIGFLVVILALAGDLLGSFIKRLYKIPPGQPVPLLDQMDFLCLVYLFLQPTLPAIGLLFLTIIIHRLANILAYKLGLKSVPY